MAFEASFSKDAMTDATFLRKTGKLAVGVFASTEVEIFFCAISVIITLLMSRVLSRYAELKARSQTANIEKELAVVDCARDQEKPKVSSRSRDVDDRRFGRTHIDGSAGQLKPPQLKPQPHCKRPEINLHDTFSIFIFDWDDTLFPTSALGKEKPEQLRATFARIDELAASLLEKTLSIPRSHVMLLTNASMEWVHQSATEYLPAVARQLLQPRERISIVSTHGSCAERGVTDRSAATAGDQTITQTKVHEALKRKAHAAQSRSQDMAKRVVKHNVHACQVVSIGDSPDDLEAGPALAAGIYSMRSVNNIYVKTIGMKPQPHGAELLGELRALSRALVPICRIAGSLHHSMHRTSSQAAPAAASAVLSVPTTPARRQHCLNAGESFQKPKSPKSVSGSVPAIPHGDSFRKLGSPRSVPVTPAWRQRWSNACDSCWTSGSLKIVTAAQL